MKIVVVSDIHDNLINLEKIFKYCRAQEIKNIICCGDVGDEETFKALAGWEGEVNVVFGNVDRDHHKLIDLQKKFINLKIYFELGLVDLGGLKIAFVHEPDKIKKLLVNTKQTADIVFYGHTHKPWSEKKDGLWLVNPGNVCNRDYAPTFACFETSTKKLDLVIINQLV